jgi:hypothetical protein
MIFWLKIEEIMAWYWTQLMGITFHRIEYITDWKNGDKNWIPTGKGINFQRFRHPKLALVTWNKTDQIKFHQILEETVSGYPIFSFKCSKNDRSLSNFPKLWICKSETGDNECRYQMRKDDIECVPSVEAENDGPPGRKQKRPDRG